MCSSHTSFNAFCISSPRQFKATLKVWAKMRFSKCKMSKVIIIKSLFHETCFKPCYISFSPNIQEIVGYMFSYKERMKKEPLDRCFAQLVESDSGYVPDNVITFYISTAVNNIIEFAFVTQNYFHSQRRTHYQQT